MLEYLSMMSKIFHVTTDSGIVNSHDLTTVAKGTRSILKAIQGLKDHISRNSLIQWIDCTLI